jgi:hypothetical protein
LTLTFAGTVGQPSHLRVQASPSEQSTASLDGTWQAQNNDLPAIELKIENSKTKASGTLTFYFQERSNPDEPWRVSSKTSGPILTSHVDGKILTFETPHHKCHTCEELLPGASGATQDFQA